MNTQKQPTPRCTTCHDRGYVDRWSWSCPDRWHEPSEPSPVEVDGVDVAPQSSKIWLPGSPVETLVGAEVDGLAYFAERGACRACAPVTGRADFDERRDRKIDRRRDRAESLRASAARDRAESTSMLPPMGEPIKVGHHSEARHRATLERSHALMGRAVASTREAERLERLADSAEASGRISSDDPRAIVKLRAKLARIEAERARIREGNRAARKAGRTPQPAYVLANLGANARRVRLRIEALEGQASAEPREDLEIGPCRVHWSVEANRVQVFTPRPEGAQARREQSSALRAAGFVWARSEGCWQRLASDRAWARAIAAAKAVAKLGEA